MMEEWLVPVLQKWHEQDAMRRQEESLARTIKGQRHEELNFIRLSNEMWVCIVVIIVFVV